MKKFLQIFLGILTAAAGLSTAHAACTIANAAYKYTYFATLTPIPKIEPEADVPDGTVLFSSPLAISLGGSNMSTQGCKGVAFTLNYVGPLGPYGTMESGIPGLGGRLKWVGAPGGL